MLRKRNLIGGRRWPHKGEPKLSSLKPNGQEISGGILKEAANYGNRKPFCLTSVKLVVR